MRLLSITSVLCFFVSTSLSYAQTTETITNTDKATVYFVRSSKVGMAINFKYFANDQYLGKCNYGNYLKVELDPGTHLLWARAEGNSYVEAELEAGQVYVLRAQPALGALYSGVKLRPITELASKDSARALRTLFRQDSLQMSTEDLAQGQLRWGKLICKAQATYEQQKSRGQAFTQLTTPIPVDELDSMLETSVVK